MPLGAQIAALGGLVGLAAAVVWILLRRRTTPEKRERQRRLALHKSGRIGDALITEATENAFFYSYSVRGVQYEASQDITALRDRLPTAPERLIGWSGMKYATNNPANSIVICEEWSGLRAPAPPSADGNAVGHETQDAALPQGAERQTPE